MQAEILAQSPPQSPYTRSNGYFGKSTKSRQSQPSMFDILTWVDQVQPEAGQLHHKADCNCNCQQREYAKQQQEVRTSPILKTQTLIGKSKENEIREKSKENIPRRKEEGVVRNGSMKRGHELERERPRSAVLREKPKKMSPPKLPKFIGDAINQQEQIEEQPIETKQKLIEKFKQTTRWIPNSAFTTYFGKPAFENYGRGNTNPSFGGLMYGNYLKSHNIQPHRGANSPKNIQSYNIALTKGEEAGTIYPYPPKASKKAHSKLLQTNDSCPDVQCTQIYGEQNTMDSLPIHIPNLFDLEKFGGKGIQKVTKSRLQRWQAEKDHEYEPDPEPKYSQNASKKVFF